MRRKQLIQKIKTSFKCQRCNECCRQPGFVYLRAKDSGRIARHLGIDQSEFVQNYCTKDDGHLVLKSREDGACVFLSDEGCEINSVKPQQCIDYPYKWRDKESYDYCEGIKLLIAADKVSKT